LPTVAQLQTLIDQDPSSPYAREAANWIILETPDGPEVEKAAGIIRGHHLQSSNLVELCEGLRRVHPRCATNLLRSILASNPLPAVQAHACLALAGDLNRRANDTGDQNLAAEARYLLERVTTEYGNILWENRKLADRAEVELSDARRLGVGQMAPEIVGENLQGQPMKLADYRGNVVVLEFWATWCGPCMARVPDERRMVERWAGKPFALVGVNSDRDRARAKAAIEKEKMTWPSFRDGDRGPIAKEWSVQSWPATYVIDRKGVIRFKNVTGAALDRVIEQLLEEPE
jgi:thiol-disulfide isomerase/thioredoxin